VYTSPNMSERVLSAEKPTTLDDAKAWAERQYRRFKTPIAKWTAMTMLALSTEGCATLKNGAYTVASVAGFEPEAELVKPSIGIAPSLKRPTEEGVSAREESSLNADRGASGMLQIGIATKPEGPGDRQWWNKGTGLYDAREFKDLNDASDTGTATPEQKRRRRAFVGGEIAGHLHYGEFEKRPTQTIAIAKFEFDPTEVLPTEAMDLEKGPRRTIADSPRKDQEPRIDEKLEQKKQLQNEVRILKLMKAYDQGLGLLLPRTNAESGVRIVPHIERRWSSAKRVAPGIGTEEKIVETEHHGIERVALRFEEIATIVPKDSESINSPEQNFLKNAFTWNDDKPVFEGHAALEDENQKAIFSRIALTDKFLERGQKLKSFEEILPFTKEIRKLQETLRADPSDSNLQKLSEAQKAFSSWKADLTEAEYKVIPTAGMEFPARQAFKLQKISPIEADLNLSRNNLDEMTHQTRNLGKDGKGSPQRDVRVMTPGSDEWAKYVVLQLHIKELESELVRLYAERDKIPQAKKVVLPAGFTIVAADQKNTKATQEANKKLQQTVEEWETLSRERSSQLRMVRDDAIKFAVRELAATSAKPMRFHVVINETEGVVAVITVMEKK